MAEVGQKAAYLPEACRRPVLSQKHVRDAGSMPKRMGWVPANACRIAR